MTMMRLMQAGYVQLCGLLYFLLNLGVNKRIENEIYKDIMHILAICQYLWPGIGCGKS